MAFPVLTRKGSKAGFSEQHSSDTVKVASKASGLPVVNKLFTFDPITWKYKLKLVSAADKATLTAFYLGNLDVPFDWDHPITGTTYEVIFTAPPAWSIAGSDGTLTWYNVTLKLTQYSPL
ncbi:hypothetical protein LCGC14_0737200 [marine sediment metagenome]|uniref:Phage tail protein n=1 Tax=marine sediment metagenome TaxID=412755 RepID=A0A0F9QSQ9_9ZZZZ